MFCACPNASGGLPNSRVCPVCLGLPGSLPVPNDEAVDLALRVALALGSRVAGRTSFARKNYFYPDLPKGYQITQFGERLALGGSLALPDRGRRIRVRQIHLEEDAGKTVHATSAGESASLVDMNRCGVPLVEIVTRPDIESIDEADLFLTELRRLLLFLGVTSGRMYEGSLRFGTNVSLRMSAGAPLGQPTEVKNLNSFRSVRRALAYELERQAKLLDSGAHVVHQTLLWNDESGRAVPMRSKEQAHDYRYFPEPDIPPVTIDDARIGRVRNEMPELPGDAAARLRESYGLSTRDALSLTRRPDTASLFESVLGDLSSLLHPRAAEAGPRKRVASGERAAAVGQAGPCDRCPPGIGGRADEARTVANWITTVAPGVLHGLGRRLEDAPRARHALASVLAALLRGEISGSSAKRVFAEVVDGEGSADAVIRRLGLSVIRDEVVLRGVARRVLDAHPEEVRRYSAGELRLRRFFMGRIMAETRGRADPGAARAALESELEGPAGP